jgi:hypothetical protein
MYEVGWSVYDIYDGYIRPLDGALAVVDIAFAPDGGILRARHDYATRTRRTSSIEAGATRSDAGPGTHSAGRGRRPGRPR